MTASAVLSTWFKYTGTTESIDTPHQLVDYILIILAWFSHVLLSMWWPPTQALQPPSLNSCHRPNKVSKNHPNTYPPPPSSGICRHATMVFFLCVVGQRRHRGWARWCDLGPLKQGGRRGVPADWLPHISRWRFHQKIKRSGSPAGCRSPAAAAATCSGRLVSPLDARPHSFDPPRNRELQPSRWAMLGTCVPPSVAMCRGTSFTFFY